MYYSNIIYINMEMCVSIVYFGLNFIFRGFLVLLELNTSLNVILTVQQMYIVIIIIIKQLCVVDFMFF